MTLQFYIAFDVDPEVPREIQHFASMKAWLHTAIDRSRSIVMQPDAHWPKLNSCLYTGTKAGRSQSYQAGYPVRNNSRDYLSQIFVSPIVVRRPVDIKYAAAATCGIMRNHRASSGGDSALAKRYCWNRHTRGEIISRLRRISIINRRCAVIHGLRVFETPLLVI